MKQLLLSLNIAAITLLVCCVAYPLTLLGFARLAAPDTASGSLIRNEHGAITGSRLIGQPFSSPRYFWGRLSAVNHDAAAAGGSNLSPTSPELTARSMPVIDAHDAEAGRVLPADLVTASGSGLDPHISLAAALYQVDRIARARNSTPDAVRSVINAHAFSPGGIFAPEKIANVMDLNLALDQLD
jgi:K+-transporting ATPase ATPase C chain